VPCRPCRSCPIEDLQGIAYGVFQAMLCPVSPVIPCKPEIFKIRSPQMPRCLPRCFGTCGMDHQKSHQNKFSENIFSTGAFCRACPDGTMAGGYMKGAKAEKLKYTKSISKVFLVPLQPLQPLATFCYSVRCTYNAVP
jgi:hypothetical protein